MSNEAVTKKKRRARGDGSIYLKGRIFWIAYRGPDGRRIKESSGSCVKGVARHLLGLRVGARALGLPVIPRVETTTFNDAAKAVIDDFTNAGKKSLADVERRLRLHLTPFFGGKRLVNISAADIRAFVSKRRADERVINKARIVKLADGSEQHFPEKRRPVSTGEVNRELQLLKRLLNLAVKDGKLARRPHIQMLDENNIRQGFFEHDQLVAVLCHLPEPVRSVIAFAAATGWRININEVLTLEWRHVDFDRNSVHLDPAKSKNKEARTFPMTAELRSLLKAQDDMRERLKREGRIVPTVFFKMISKGRGGEKAPKPVGEFRKTWHNACRTAGCVGKIPHDLRRTAVRNFVRAGIPERVAMKLTGHKTRSVFDRYDITSGGNLDDAAARLDRVAAGTSGVSRSGVR